MGLETAHHIILPGSACALHILYSSRNEKAGGSNDSGITRHDSVLDGSGGHGETRPLLIISKNMFDRNRKRKRDWPFTRSPNGSKLWTPFHAMLWGRFSRKNCGKTSGKTVSIMTHMN